MLRDHPFSRPGGFGADGRGEESRMPGVGVRTEAQRRGHAHSLNTPDAFGVAAGCSSTDPRDEAISMFVEPPVVDAEGPDARRLTALHPGQRATVFRLDEALQGLTRRRLLDLGLTPGTAIIVEISSITGDPMAYRVRGSLIALRREQAKHVVVKVEGDQKPQPQGSGLCQAISPPSRRAGRGTRPAAPPQP